MTLAKEDLEIETPRLLLRRMTREGLDFYTRLHAVSKAETLGVALTISALVLWVGPTLLAVKLALVAVFLFLANPTSTHAIARAALRTGLRPWRREPGEGAAPRP